MIPSIALTRIAFVRPNSQFIHPKMGRQLLTAQPVLEALLEDMFARGYGSASGLDPSSFKNQDLTGVRDVWQKGNATMCIAVRGELQSCTKVCSCRPLLPFVLKTRSDIRCDGLFRRVSPVNIAIELSNAFCQGDFPAH